jgi:hypothetical protein
MEGRGGKLMFAVINFISFNTQYTQNKKDMISYDFDIQVSIFLEKRTSFVEHWQSLTQIYQSLHSPALTSVNLSNNYNIPAKILQ